MPRAAKIAYHRGKAHAYEGVSRLVDDVRMREILTGKARKHNAIVDEIIDADIEELVGEFDEGARSAELYALYLAAYAAEHSGAPGPPKPKKPPLRRQASKQPSAQPVVGYHPSPQNLPLSFTNSVRVGPGW